MSPRAPKSASMQQQPPAARGAALDILAQVLDRHTPFHELLESHPALAALEARDRAFVHVMVATVLRRLGQIDALVAHCLRHPLPPKARATHHLLRLGVAQLLFLGVPAHAAVSETVMLAESVDRGGFKSLANAVLRRLASEGEALVAGQDAVRINTPDWLWESWRAAYGESVCRAIAAAHLTEPPLDLTVKERPGAWAERLGAVVLPTGTLRRPVVGEVSALAGFAEGAWWVQDAAAALPARLLGEVAGKHVLDICAAPGGKTAQLALGGGHVTALDRSATRLKRVADNLARLGLRADLVAANAETWRPESPADAVLLDAPCTSTGTIRRHPDVAHLKTAEDVARMSAEQDRLLHAAAEMVRPGGLLVFSTCSLQPEEGPLRIRAFLDQDVPFRRRTLVPAEVGGIGALINDDGDLRTHPGHLAGEGGLDGFYACRLERL